MPLHVRHTARRLALVLAMVAMASAAWCAAEPDDAPLSFRRVFAPADRIEQWPRDAGRYVPMKRNEFEEAVTDINRRATSPQTRATIERAEYAARLRDDGALEGRADLQIASRGAGRTLMPLGDCDLAIQSAAWTDDSKPAEFGRDAAGRLMVVVDRSATLRLQWRLARTLVRGRTTFKAAIPTAATCRLSLDLPADSVPLIASGIAEEDRSAPAPTEGMTPLERRRSWRIELGGRPTLDLSIAASDSDRRRVVVARIDHQYDIAPRGLSLTTALHLDIYHEPIDRLSVRLDPGLTLVAARLGAKPIAIQSRRTTSDGATAVVLKFPEPLEGVDRSLILEATGGATFDRRWRLPTISADSVERQETTAHLSVQRPLQIQQLLSEGGQLSAPATANSATLDLFSPTATIDLVAAWQSRTVTGDAALIADVGADSAARYQFDADFSDAAEQTLTAAIHPSWSIDSVAADPPDALRDWSILGQNQQARLAIDCRPPSTQHVRFTVALRWRGVAGAQPLSADDLAPLRFAAPVRIRRSLVSIAALAPFRLAAEGDERLVPLDLATDPVARKLLSDHAGAMQFNLDSSAARLKIRADRAIARFSASVAMHVQCERNKLDVRYVVDAAPRGDPLGQLIVRFAPPSSDPLHWANSVAGSAPLDARHLSETEAQAAGFDADQELWLIRFPQPRTTPFQLVATRSSKLDRASPVALAAVAAAETQRNTVIIAGSAAAALSIENFRLTAIPPPATSPPLLSQFDDLRAAFSYRSTDLSSTTPALQLSPSDPASALATAIAYSCDTSAWLHTAGRIEMRSNLRFENFGRQSIQLTFPPATERYEISIAGESVAQGSAADAPVLAPLPRGQRYVSLTARWSLATPPLGALRQVSLPALAVDVPVLHRRLTVWTPAEYALAGHNPLAAPRSDAWQRRWFGPLARDEHTGPWLPLLRTTPLDELPALSREQATDRAHTILAAIGSELLRNNAASPIPWSELLAAANASIAGEASLVIDPSALDAASITPETRIARPPRDTASRADAAAVAARILRDAGLTFVLDGDSAVLTSTIIAPTATSLVPIDSALTTGQTDSTSFRSYWAAAPLGADRVSTMTLAAWRLRGEFNSLPWSFANSAQPWEGWLATELALDTAPTTSQGPAAPPLTVFYVLNNAVISAVGYGAMLLSIVVGWRLLRARRSAVALLAIAAAATALFLPDRWSQVAIIPSLVWWGLLLGACLGALRRPARLAVSPAPSANSLRPWKVASATALLVLALFCASALRAQPAPAAPPVHQVFFPVDENQKPAGEMVYVPEALFARLQRSIADRDHAPHGWLLSAANYRTTLDWQAAPPREAAMDEDAAPTDEPDARLGLSQCTANYNVLTFDAEARIHIAAGPRPAKAEIRVDGQLLEDRQFTWSGNDLMIAVVGAGTHRAEVTLRPSSFDRASLAGVSIPIAAAGSVRLEVLAPEDGPVVEIAPSAQSIPAADGRIRLSMPLASTSDKTAAETFVRWPKTAPRAATTNRLDSDELLTLDVRPGSVAFSARVTLRSTGPMPAEFRVAVDKRLAPLAAAVGDASLTWRRAVGQVDYLVYRLPETTARELRVDLQFLVQSTQGIGSLRLPRWEPAVAAVRRRWLAVNIDPGLDPEVVAGADAQPMSVAEFAQQSPASAEPRFAYRLDRGETSWSLTTRRRRPDVSVDQTTSLIADSPTHDSAQLRIDFTADVAIKTGNLYQHTLNIPAGMQVESATLTDDAGTDITSFWSTDERGALQLFAADRLGAKQRIRVTGVLSAPAPAKFEWPSLHVAGAKSTSDRCRILRKPAARVAFDNLTGLTDVSAPADEVTPPTEPPKPSKTSGVSTASAPTSTADQRLLRDFSVDLQRGGAGVIEVARNEPRIDATLTTTVEQPLPAAWHIALECQGVVNSGAADELIFDLPGVWTAGPTIDGPLTATLSEVAGVKRLTYRPALPIRGAFRIAIRGVLALPQDASLPRFRLRTAAPQAEYWILPTRWQSQPLAWQPRELRVAPSPSKFALPQTPGGAWQVYRLASDRASATLAPSLAALSPAKAVAEIIVAPRDRRSYTGLATFDVLPEGVAQLAVTMPEGAETLAVIVEGRVAAIRKSATGFLTPLESPSNPQRIEVFYSAAISDDAALQRWQAPSLAGVELLQTDWRLLGPADARAPRVVDSADNEPLATARRGESLATIYAAYAPAKSTLGTKSSSTTITSPIEVSPLTALFLRADLRLRPDSATDAAMPIDATDNSSSALRYVTAAHDSATPPAAWTSLATQFSATPLGQFGSQTLFAISPSQADGFAAALRRADPPSPHVAIAVRPSVATERALLARAASPLRQLAAASFAGASSQWTTSAPREFVVAPRWLVGTLLLLAVAIPIRRRWRTSVASAIASQAPLYLAALGVAWWLWLAAGWIGWLFVAAALLLALSNPWSTAASAKSLATRHSA